MTVDIETLRRVASHAKAILEIDAHAKRVRDGFNEFHFKTLALRRESEALEASRVWLSKEDAEIRAGLKIVYIDDLIEAIQRDPECDQSDEELLRLFVETNGDDEDDEDEPSPQPSIPTTP